jgi:hypothetical protein
MDEILETKKVLYRLLHQKAIGQDLARSDQNIMFELACDKRIKQFCVQVVEEEEAMKKKTMCNDPVPCAECVEGIDCTSKKVPLDTLPDLSRTAQAIREYDAYKIDWDGTNTYLLKAIDKQDALAEAVGIAFGLDTADRNSMDTCRRFIRPGFAVPAPGYELSFVRRMVALWKEGKLYDQKK